LRRTSVIASRPWIPWINTSKDPAALKPFDECVNIENRITGVRDSFQKRPGINKDWDSGTSGTDSVIGGSDYWYLDSGVKTQTKVTVNEAGVFRKYASDGTITAITNDGIALTTPTICSMEVYNGKLIMAFDGSSNRVKKYSGTGNITDLEAGFDHTTASRSSSGTTRTLVLAQSFKGLNGDRIVVAGVGEATYNGNFTVTSVSTTTLTNDTITYTASGALAEGSTADTGGTVDGLAPNGNIIAKHQGRALLTDKNEKDRLHYSETFNHEKWWGYGDSGAMDFDPDDNDPEGITGVFPTFNGDLFVAKKTKLYRVIGVIPFHQIVTVSESIGCVSHETIAAIDKTDIIWASEKGVHSLATTVQYGDYEEAFISADIQESFNEDWSISRRKYMKGRYLSNENVYMLGVTEEDLGTTANNCVWLYHTTLKRWISRWPNVECETVFIANDSDRRRAYFGSSTGRVYQSFTDDRFDTSEAGTEAAVSALAKTGLIFPAGDPTAVCGFKRVILYYTPKSTQTISISAKIDKFSAQSTAFDETGGGTPLGTGFTLGSTRLGSEGMYAPYSRLIDGYGHGVQLTLTENTKLANYSIEGIGLEFQPMDLTHDPNKGVLEE
jgi:hypothetical protein